MRLRRSSSSGVASIAFFLAFSLSLAEAAPRYYIVVRDVEGPGPKDDPTVAMARQIFIQDLSQRPEVTLDPAGLPAGGPALAEELKKRRLRGYQVTLRLLNVGRALNTPPPGKPFRVLERSVKLTVVGSTLPGDLLALGGDGESTIQADVGPRISEKQERDLLSDALHDAIGQAVAQALRKLEMGSKTPPPEKSHQKARKGT